MSRKPVKLDIMLRVHFPQQWFALSDPEVEDALYESPVLRRFAGIDLGRAPVPDETTIVNFRHLPETHELCGQMLDVVNVYLGSKGIRITTSSDGNCIWPFVKIVADRPVDTHQLFVVHFRSVFGIEFAAGFKPHRL